VKTAEFVTLLNWEGREMKRKEMVAKTIQQCQLASLHLQFCVVCFGTAPFVKIRHVSEISPRKAVNTHTSLKDR